MTYKIIYKTKEGKETTMFGGADDVFALNAEGIEIIKVIKKQGVFQKPLDKLIKLWYNKYVIKRDKEKR